jgi:uncharacterized protein
MNEQVYHEAAKKVNPGKALGVFAKRPRAGEVKTRLAAATSAAWAARVAEACLADTLSRLATVEARRYLVFAPDDADMSASAADAYTPVPQGPGKLGHRLARFFERFLAAGRVIVVGSDSPTLPVGYVERGFDELLRVDVVLGPATDGGYYLIGCRRFLPELFEGIDWGGPQVLQQTIERLPPGSSLSLLPPWYDVDTMDGWHMLTGHITAMRRTGIDPGVPRVEALSPT